MGAKFLPSYRIFPAVTYLLGSATVTCKCFRSMKKNEAPHSLQVSIGLADKTIPGKCSCVVGISRYCHHVIREGTFFYWGGGGGVGPGPRRGGSLVNFFTNRSNLLYSQPGEGHSFFFGKEKITPCRLVDSHLLTNTRSV